MFFRTKLCLLLLLPLYLNAQDEPEWVVMTTVHWNMDKEDGSDEEWMALAKEYHQKVTMNNELIVRAGFLTHFFTEDNTEARILSGFRNWEDIDKAAERDEELIAAAWPDTNARDAFFEKFDSYFDNLHSDEIYRVVPGMTKSITSQSTGETVVLMQRHQRAYPEDGSGEEFRALHKEYVMNTSHMNPSVIGYFNWQHGWGSDNRDFIEVTVVENLAALEAGFEKENELINAHWPDEAARNAFFDKYDKYFTGVHADYLFHGIPELRK
jgi:hypothetical protein